MFYVRLLTVTVCYVFVVRRLENSRPPVRYIVHTLVTFLLTLYFGWLGLATAAVSLLYPDKVKKCIEAGLYILYRVCVRLFNN